MVSKSVEEGISTLHLVLPLRKGIALRRTARAFGLSESELCNLWLMEQGAPAMEASHSYFFDVMDRINTYSQLRIFWIWITGR